MKLRTWKILYWDSYGNEYFMFIKKYKLSDVILTFDILKVYNKSVKYSIFDDKGNNVSNDGVSPLNKMMN